MTKDEKDLLLKDLCSRLPYDVFVNINDIKCVLQPHDISDLIKCDVDIKPYLIPLSSITIEKKGECPCGWSMIDAWIDGKIYLYEDEELNIDEIINMLDWLNKNHFDYRGLIEKGLALKAPDGMYN